MPVLVGFQSSCWRSAHCTRRPSAVTSAFARLLMFAIHSVVNVCRLLPGDEMESQGFWFHHQRFTNMMFTSRKHFVTRRGSFEILVCNYLSLSCRVQWFQTKIVQSKRSDPVIQSLLRTRQHWRHHKNRKHEGFRKKCQLLTTAYLSSTRYRLCMDSNDRPRIQSRSVSHLFFVYFQVWEETNGQGLHVVLADGGFSVAVHTLLAFWFLWYVCNHFHGIILLRNLAFHDTSHTS